MRDSFINFAENKKNTNSTDDGFQDKIKLDCESVMLTLKWSEKMEGKSTRYCAKIRPFI